MAIYQRDREFHRLFSEIEVDIIPIKFVRDITCYLIDGTTITLNESDLKKRYNDDGNLETVIKELEFYDDLTDLQIRINYDRVEKDVGAEVKNILSKLTK
jgi:hypothetical protein